MLFQDQHVQPIRLIMVGAGGMARHWWERALCRSADFHLVGLAEPNRSSLDAVRQIIGLDENQCGPSLETLLRRVQADAVLLVSPPHCHAPDAMLAFSHGLHVLTEKPMSDSLESAKTMVDAARAAGRQLMVGQNRRHEDWAPLLRQMLADNSIGRLGAGYVEHFFNVPVTSGYRSELEHILLEDMSIHHLDLIRGMTGRNIIKVAAQIFSLPWWDHRGSSSVNLLMTLDGGIPFTYTGSWAAPGRPSAWGGDWRLMGENGVIRINQDVMVVARDRFAHERGVEYPQTPDRGQPALLGEFAQAIRTGTSALTSGEDNLWSVAAMFAAIRSNAERREIDVRELLEQAKPLRLPRANCA